MNRRKALKHARDIVKYIMSQSEYELDPCMQEYLAERIAFTLRLNNGEMLQDSINSLIHHFKKEKELSHNIAFTFQDKLFTIREAL